MFCQVKFQCGEKDYNKILGGIAKLDNDGNIEYIICGCCGGVFEKDDIYDGIFQFSVYENWIDISQEILGDENNE